MKYSYFQLLNFLLKLSLLTALFVCMTKHNSVTYFAGVVRKNKALGI